MVTREGPHAYAEMAVAGIDFRPMDKRIRIRRASEPEYTRLNDNPTTEKLDADS